MAVYYNETDPYAAQWLRNLIAAGHIADGEVDERSIEDVNPEDLRGYAQCHFFAGIGVWNLAMRRAGWPDDRPVWTGSCPCQPFSAAGKGAGFDDERHLWPAWQWLIAQCRPPVIIGEQIASKAAEPWIELVQADLEALGYAFGCIAFPSAGVGAPHIRDRAYWVGHANQPGPQGLTRDGGAAGRQGSDRSVTEAGSVSRRADATGKGLSHGGARSAQPEFAEADGSATGGVADTDSNRRNQGREGVTSTRSDGVKRDSADDGPNSTNGFWRDADWLFCRDGKWRPVEPGSFPLADGLTNRVGRLRAYGNAVNAKASEIFIRSYAAPPSRGGMT